MNNESSHRVTRSGLAYVKGKPVGYVKEVSIGERKTDTAWQFKPAPEHINIGILMARTKRDLMQLVFEAVTRT